MPSAEEAAQTQLLVGAPVAAQSLPALVETAISGGGGGGGEGKISQPTPASGDGDHVTTPTTLAPFAEDRRELQIASYPIDQAAITSAGGVPAAQGWPVIVRACGPHTPSPGAQA